VTSIRWTTEAADHLEAHVNRIREKNPEAARAMARAVLSRIAQLQTFPNLGRPGEAENTRELVTGSYVIVYWLVDDVAEILYIWHGAQDWR
jgi:toxin ParE1/3/4